MPTLHMCRNAVQKRGHYLLWLPGRGTIEAALFKRSQEPVKQDRNHPYIYTLCLKPFSFCKTYRDVTNFSVSRFN